MISCGRQEREARRHCERWREERATESKTDLLRRHDEGPVLHDRLVERLAGDENKADVVARRLEPDARRAVLVREHGRVVLLDGRRERAARCRRRGRGRPDARLALEGVDLRARR